MKLYVSSLNPFFGREMAEMVLKKIGITRKIDEFSDCLNNCKCKNFKEGLEIRFDSLHMRIAQNSKFRIYILHPIKNLFIGGRGYKFLVSTKSAGSYKREGSLITLYLSLDNIFAWGMGLYDVIKHELLHINSEEHCQNPRCFFSNSGAGGVGFCPECQENLKKTIEKINEGTLFE